MFSSLKKRYRKAQAGASVLLIVIVLLIVVYMLLLPPDDRAALLGDDSLSWGNGMYASNVILSENVGRLDYLQSSEIPHGIPSFTIYTTTNAMPIKSVDSLYVLNNAFTEKTAITKFFIDHLNTDNLLLSFNVIEGQGTLSVVLNDFIIAENEFSGTPAPIVLPDEYLHSENILEFSVSGVGFAFWNTNKYYLSDILVSGQVVDRSAQAAIQHFIVSESEYQNLEKLELEFLTDCDESNVGPLHVEVNGYEVFFAVPDCGGMNKIDVSKNFVYQEDNTILFMSEKGEYDVQQTKITSILKEAIPPVYYFTMPSDLFQAVYSNQVPIYLTLTFVDDVSVKMGTVTINGNTNTFNTQNNFYSMSINPTIKEGTNSVKIAPEVPGLDIATFEIIFG